MTDQTVLTCCPGPKALVEGGAETELWWQLPYRVSCYCHARTASCSFGSVGVGVQVVDSQGVAGRQEKRQKDDDTAQCYILHGSCYTE